MYAMSALTAPTIQQAWAEFQASGRCDEQLIAPPIARSWQRCQAAGLDPLRGGEQSPGPPPTLDASQNALAALARPYMEDLYQFVEGSGFAVLLADPSLLLIEVLGDAPMLDDLRAQGLVRGAGLHEEQVGTLALNLALHEALPWQTRGAEHFCARYHQLACSAAPIFDPRGNMLGVLDVTGDHRVHGSSAVDLDDHLHLRRLNARHDRLAFDEARPHPVHHVQVGPAHGRPLRCDVRIRQGSLCSEDL